MKRLAALLIAGALANPSTFAANKTSTLAVKGWTCGSCAVSTRIALQKLDGIRSIMTDTDKSEVVVTYDGSKITPENLIQAIEKLGYSAALVVPPKGQSATESTAPFDKATTTLSVGGISGEGSVVALKNELKRAAGVISYDVNGARDRVEIAYDAGSTDAGTIAESLLKAGVKVRLSMWEPVDASFDGCSNGSCGTRVANAQVSPQLGSAPGQRVYCPVSGVVLLVKASTPSVDVGGKTVHVCCEGCARYFNANRDRVLALRGLNPAS